MDLDKYVKKHLNAILLSPSHEAIIPGAVLDIQWEEGTAYWLKTIFSLGIYKQQFTVHIFNGHIGSYLEGLTAKDCETTEVSGNLAVESASQKLKLSNSIVLPQYGLNINALFKNETQSTLAIKNISTRIFKTPNTVFKIFQMFHALTRKASYDSHKLHEWLANDLVVTEAFYASSLTWTFHKKLNLEAVIDYLVKANKVHDETAYEQIDDKTISISGVTTAPFAVRGIWLTPEDK